jgi:hypothetical protein
MKLCCTTEASLASGAVHPSRKTGFCSCRNWSIQLAAQDGEPCTIQVGREDYAQKAITTLRLLVYPSGK